MNRLVRVPPDGFTVVKKPARGSRPAYFEASARVPNLYRPSQTERYMLTLHPSGQRGYVVGTYTGN